MFYTKNYSFKNVRFSIIQNQSKKNAYHLFAEVEVGGWRLCNL